MPSDLRSIFSWVVAGVVACHAAGARADEPVELRPIAKLGPGAGKEISGIVKSRTQEGLFWTLNDSGDEPRVYPIRADGSVVASVRAPEKPGVLIAGALNNDWEDIAIDSSGRLVIADFGNNSNARGDLTLYLVEEPEADCEKAVFTSRIVFKYPDQPSRPAPKGNFNFDAEGVFTVGDDIFVLSKNRSDTYTKLYRVDERAPNRVNTLTYVDRVDTLGQVTGADCSPDGLRLAVLTYERVWLFERREIGEPFFSGKVSGCAYRLSGNTGPSDSESICFEDDSTLLIADETRGELFRLPLKELKEIRPARTLPSTTPDNDVRVMSWNIRYAGGDTGPNAWTARREPLAAEIERWAPDVLGLQEVEAAQADWLRARLPEMGFCGVGRLDGERRGEFSPVMFRADRFTLLASGHFWISPTPEVPGAKGWDAACERMATWVRLRDRDGRVLLVLNTHLDHVGVQARARGLELIRARLEHLAEGAAIVITGDFNTSADGPDARRLLDDPSAPDSPRLGLVDSFRRVFPARDADEATYCDWKPRTDGERIDWIITSDALFPVSAAIERSMPGGRCVSDHYAVTAILRGSDAPKR